MALVNDLWIVDFGDPYPGEPANHRPALVLGPPATFGSDFPFVMVCPLTTSHRGLSLHIEVEHSDSTGLTDTSYIQCELLRSINRNRLVHHLGLIDRVTGQAVAGVVKSLLNY